MLKLFMLVTYLLLDILLVLSLDTFLWTVLLVFSFPLAGQSTVYLLIILKKAGIADTMISDHLYALFL